MMARFRALPLAFMLFGCGGGGSGNGGTVAAPPAPVPTHSPSPSAPPTASYATYAQLRGDQSFATGCASLQFDNILPQARPTRPFGTGLTLRYQATTETYTVAADTVERTVFGPQDRSFGPADRDPAAPAGTTGYLRAQTGFQERLSIGANAAAGSTPDYVRGFSLRTPLYGNITPAAQALQYLCVFGVPTRIGDEPGVPGVTFTRGGLNGVAYMTGPTGGLETYALSASEVRFSVDLATYRVSTSIRLLGRLQSAAGPADTTVDLGTFQGAVDLNEAGYYNGLLASTDRNNMFSTFGGWFFGPQGTEAAYAISITAQDPATGRRMSAIGNVIALR